MSKWMIIYYIFSSYLLYGYYSLLHYYYNKYLIREWGYRNSVYYGTSLFIKLSEIYSIVFLGDSLTLYRSI